MIEGVRVCGLGVRRAVRGIYQYVFAFWRKPGGRTRAKKDRHRLPVSTLLLRQSCLCPVLHGEGWHLRVIFHFGFFYVALFILMEGTLR